MRRLFALTVLIAAVLALRTRADAPDDQYVQVYHLLQEADDAKAGGQSDFARAKYLEAQTVLKKLQSIYPEWNKKMIDYRLSYIEGKLEGAKAGAPSTGPASAVAKPVLQAPARLAPARPLQSPPPAPVPQVNPEIQEKNNEIVGLQAVVSRLEADKNILDAKLKEALAAQPAAVDPRELAKAEERIKTLEKEKDLLQVTLNNEKSKKGEPARPPAELDGLRKQLQAQSDTIAALTAEKKVLEGRLQTPPAPSNELAALKLENQTLKTQLANLPSPQPAATAVPPALSNELAALKLENQTLKTQLASLSASQPAPKVVAQAPAAPDQTALVSNLQKQVKSQGDTITALTNQRRDLESRLQATPKDTSESKNLRSEIESLKKQLASAQAKPAPQPKPVAPSPQESPKKIASLETSIKSLEEKNAALQKENKDLDGRIKASAKPASEGARVKQLEKERDDLLKKLNEASRASVEKKGKNKKDDGATEVASLRAKIGALEAQKVPFTAEELALFKPTALNTAPKVEPAPEAKKPTKEPPAGSSVLVAEAQRAFGARRLDEAEAKYKQVLKLDEKNVYTLANLAAIEVEARRYDDAEKNLNAALALDPEDSFSLSLMGILKFRQDKFDAALDALSRSAQLDPKNAETQNYLGITLSQKGQRAAAEAALRRSIQLAPNYAGAHHNLAVIYATQNPPFIELAKWHYQKAIANGHPQNPDLEKILDGKK